MDHWNMKSLLLWVFWIFPTLTAEVAEIVYIPTNDVEWFFSPCILMKIFLSSWWYVFLMEYDTVPISISLLAKNVRYFFCHLLTSCTFEMCIFISLACFLLAIRPLRNTWQNYSHFVGYFFTLLLPCLHSFLVSYNLVCWCHPPYSLPKIPPTALRKIIFSCLYIHVYGMPDLFYCFSLWYRHIYDCCANIAMKEYFLSNRIMICNSDILIPS